MHSKLLLASTFGAAAAFQAPAASKATSSLKAVYNPSSFDDVQSLPGILEPTGFFDPAGFSEGVSSSELKRYREAELTHGRVAMLASLGFLVQEFYHPLFSPEITNVAINQIPELPPVFWFALTLGISAAEITRIQLGFANPYEANVKGKKGARDEVKGTLKEGYYPGDLRFDPLNIKPTTPDAFRQMQVTTRRDRHHHHRHLHLICSTSLPCRSASSRTAASPCSPPPASSRRDRRPGAVGLLLGHRRRLERVLERSAPSLISLCMCCVGVSCRGVRRNRPIHLSLS